MLPHIITFLQKLFGFCWREILRCDVVDGEQNMADLDASAMSSTILYYSGYDQGTRPQHMEAKTNFTLFTDKM